jgi:hypothetical protein
MVPVENETSRSGESPPAKTTIFIFGFLSERSSEKTDVAGRDSVRPAQPS